MRDLPPLDGDVVEVDGRGLLRDPRPRRLPHAPGVRRRPRRGVLAARGAARATRSCTPRGGGILSTVRATRAAGEDGLRAAVERHRELDARARARRRSRRSRATGSTARPSSRRCARSATPGGIPTWLGAHAVPPEFDGDADAYLDFALAEVLPEAAELAEAADVFLERGAFDAAQARRYLEACRDGRARAAPARRPVHRAGRDPARDRARRALGRPSRGDRRRGRPRARGERRRRRAAAGERPLPRPADAAGAGARRRRRRRRARDRLQPGQRLLREPAALLLARGDAARSSRRRRRSPRARSTPRTCSAGPTGSGGSRPGYRADVVLLDAPGLALPRVPPRRRARRTRSSRRPASYAEPACRRGNSGAASRRRSGTSTSSSTSTTRATSSTSVPEELRASRRSERPSCTQRLKAGGEERSAARRPRLGRTPPAAVVEPRVQARRHCSASSSSSSSRSAAKGHWATRSAARGALHRPLRPVHVRDRPLRLPAVAGTPAGGASTPAKKR